MRLGPARTLGQIVLIESLPDQCLNDCLPAYVEILRRLVQFFQHAGCDVDIDPLYGLYHPALAREKMGDVFTLIGLPCNRIGRNAGRY